MAPTVTALSSQVCTDESRGVSHFLRLWATAFAVAALSIALAGVCLPTSASAAMLSLSTPFQIDNQPPFAQAYPVGSMQCPSSNLCVMLDANGRVLTSTDPTGGAADWQITRIAALSGAADVSVGEPSYLSCPTTTLCIGFSGRSVITSTDPTGGAAKWVTSTLASSTGPNEWTCSSASFCIATASGEMWTSTDPAAGASSWTMTTGSTVPSAVACASSSLCIGVANSGEIFTSTSPGSGAGSWTESDVDGENDLVSVACSTTADPVVCVAGDGQDNVLTISDPGGAGATWQIAPLTGLDGVDRVTCTADASLCVALDEFGDVATTTTPTLPVVAGVTLAWRVTTQDSPNQIASVSCPTSSLCLGSDDGGDVLSSSTPASASNNSWTVSKVDGYSALSGMTCPTTTLCLAVDSAGNLLTTTTPTAKTGYWQSFNLDTHPLTGVSCDPSLWCVAIDGSGDVLTTTDPTGGKSAWTSTKIDSNGLDAVSCAAGPICAVADAAGDVFTSTNPGGTWSGPVGVGAPADDELTSIACAATTLCVVGDFDGDLYTSVNASGATPNWIAAGVKTVGKISGIACPSTSVCLAVTNGVQLTSTNPTGGASAWTANDNINGMQTVSCVSTTFCLLAGYGEAYVDDPGVATKMIFNSAGAWNLPVSACTTNLVCTVGDDHGNAFVAIVPPTDLSAPLIFGQALPGKTLSCADGNWVGEQPISYAYAWLAGGTAIPGATSSQFTVTAADEGKSLACVVGAVNAGGVTAALSSSVTVPVPGPGTATAQTVAVSGSSVKERLLCQGDALATCSFTILLKASETIISGKHHTHKHKLITIATASLRIDGAQTVLVTLHLNRAGAALLKKLHKLQATLSVTQKLQSTSLLITSRTVKLKS